MIRTYVINDHVLVVFLFPKDGDDLQSHSFYDGERFLINIGSLSLTFVKVHCKWDQRFDILQMRRIKE